MIYKISFTSGGLYARDAIKVAELYLRFKDWKTLKDYVVDENILQARTKSSLARTSTELLQRLQGMTDAQIELLVNGSSQEQKQILWLAACKHYVFVRDFATEVVREKYLRLDWEISYADYDIFFNNKAEWHPELAKITETTRKKLRQVLFRMMTEAGIISSANVILPSLLSPSIVKVIMDDDPTLFSVFPISDADIRKS